MVHIDIRYEGELRCRLSHGPSGAQVSTDAPLDNHGRGESFSPSDLVAGALGACMLTIMGIAARKHGWDLSGAEASVDKEMVSDPERRIGRLRVSIRVPAELDERARTTLERAAHACPVHRSLRADVDIPVVFHWGARADTAS